MTETFVPVSYTSDGLVYYSIGADHVGDTGAAYRGANATALSTTLTLNGVAGAKAFASDDVGKTICVVGAGNNGSDLYTTIASLNTSASVELSTAAQTSTSNTTALWWPADQNDTGQLQTAINNCTVDSPFVRLSAGVFVISSSLSSSAMFKGLLGQGKTATWLVASSDSFRGDMLAFTSLPRGVQVCDLAIKGPGLSTLTSSCAVSDWSCLSNVVTLTGSNGFSVGDNVLVTGFQSGPTTLNGQRVTVTAQSPLSFSFAFTRSDGTGTNDGFANMDTNGISFPQGVLAGPTFRDVLFLRLPGSAMKTQGVITGRFAGLIAESCGGHGFSMLVDSESAAGTSCHWETCYSNGCYGAGYYFRTLNYSTMTDCAADSCGTSYYLHGGAGFTLNACGSEVPIYRNAALAGTHYLVWGPNSLVMNAPYATTNSTVANTGSHGFVFGNTSRDCIVNVPKFNGTSGTLPTYFWDIQSGCRSITIWEPNFTNFPTSSWRNNGVDCAFWYDGAFHPTPSTSVSLLTGSTQSTVGSAGAASALPAAPTAYIPININGVELVVPAYNKA